MSNKVAKTRTQGSEAMPSSDINPGNSIQRVEECMKYMTLQQWNKFYFLYPKLQKFQEIRIKGAGKMLRDDEFTNAWNNLRANSVDLILKNLESASSFDEFLDWMKKLSDIVTDHRCLWNILHTEVQPTLKVTLEQSRQIAAKFFSPEMLFEFGVESFLISELADFSNAKTEDDIIDMFYGAAGFIRSCNLPANYEIKDQGFIDFVKQLLTNFSQIPDFDAHQFVWLIESIQDHLHIPMAVLRPICENVVHDYVKQEIKNDSFARLYKMCIISTSPFLQQLTMLQSSINTVFRNVLKEQRKFVHKYIFGSYVHIIWDKGDLDDQKTQKKLDVSDEEQDDFSRPTDPLISWKLYINNLAHRVKSKSELPDMLIIDCVNDSLDFFIAYYSEVQPLKDKSAKLRIDIFELVTTIKEVYPGDIPEEKLKNMWFLLYIAAVSGAPKELLDDVKHMNSPKGNDPFLGLEHTSSEFNDYKVALGRLSMKFEIEFESFPIMVKYIRKKYEGEDYGNDEEEVAESAENEKT